MAPNANMKKFKASFVDCILLGLLTLLFYLFKMPLRVIMVVFLLCCAILLCEVKRGFNLIWCSLTKKASRRLNESTPLLTSRSDLEAQSTDNNQTEEVSQNPRRSSPLPIPRRRSDQHETGPMPWLVSRPWMASLPWMDSSLASWYLEWRRKHVAHERRSTLSESVTVNQLNEVQRTSRNHTLSESAVYDLKGV